MRNVSPSLKRWPIVARLFKLLITRLRSGIHDGFAIGWGSMGHQQRATEMFRTHFIAVALGRVHASAEQGSSKLGSNVYDEVIIFFF